MDGEGAHSIPLAYTPGAWNEYELDVTADAIAHFTTGGQDTLRGEDNSLGMAKIGLETRNGVAACVYFDEYRLEVDPLLVDDTLLARAADMADYYETLFPDVTNYLGTEVSKYRGQPHLNGFAPNLSLVDYTGHGWTDTLYYAIDQIHAQDGAVSLNHWFGTGFDYRANPDETPEEQAQRAYYQKEVLVGARALGVDVLEVGYRRRGGMDLVHHLDLWDTLVGNAIFVTGTGVTDSHGRGEYQLDGWGPSELGITTVNNFVTWLHTEEFSEAGFVHAMKSGRAHFGDPYRWNGDIDLQTTDGFRMGQIVLTDRDDHDLMIQVTNVQPDVQVRLRQIEIRDHPTGSYINITHLRDELLAGEVIDSEFLDEVAIDTTVPSLVRIEVLNGSAEEMAYSNPVHFVREMPIEGMRAERAAFRLSDIRLHRAEGIDLTEVTFADSTSQLTIRGNEDVVGMGLMKLDPGLLGAPSLVTGADTWSYQGSILVVEGFSGTGSEIMIDWGPTAAGIDPRNVTDLQLGLGRPNPFGKGMITDYAVPREGWVRLEVIDVSGRRVRVLELGFREQGRHRAHWDGRDERGRPVANGVYYLRLSHDGETRVSKAVRLR
jgi:hypothetical protein